MGNFKGFFIPNKILEELSFSTDEEYELNIDGQTLVIGKSGDLPQETLKEFGEDDLDAWSSCLEDLDL